MSTNFMKIVIFICATLSLLAINASARETAAYIVAPKSGSGINRLEGRIQSYQVTVEAESESSAFEVAGTASHAAHAQLALAASRAKIDAKIAQVFKQVCGDPEPAYSEVKEVECDMVPREEIESQQFAKLSCRMRVFAECAAQ